MDEKTVEKQYLRFKRETKTFFIQCYPDDSVELLKLKLQDFLEMDPNDMRLYIGTRLIDDKSTVHNQDLKNDSIIKILIRKPGIGGGAGEWEIFEAERPPSESDGSSTK